MSRLKSHSEDTGLSPNLRGLTSWASILYSSSRVVSSRSRSVLSITRMMNWPAEGNCERWAFPLMSVSPAHCAPGPVSAPPGCKPHRELVWSQALTASLHFNSLFHLGSGGGRAHSTTSDCVPEAGPSPGHSQLWSGPPCRWDHYDPHLQMRRRVPQEDRSCSMTHSW